ncbi:MULTISPECIES: thiamine ABC transporter ATP-binding protein [unclassified Aminobacter]|uniref:thiamine ABC transporter ATP-binding protein n=1 Tax=unclassified Aminobacter TaxID=2644704 RepID=UPI000463757F|nr:MULTISPECIES: thiamine ABC transporter ATP-binding protein [unclassified Aminobacter]TWH30436.1 thiamine transport system ATP-binding protein [Aminobacter sp. J15]
MSGASIELRNLVFSYDETRMEFDLSVPASSVIAIMGPSGSGKTTLLNLIAGFEKPVSGKVLIDGRDVTGLEPAERPVSMVFQENNLFAHLTVEDNVGLGRSPSLRLTDADRADIAQALAQTGLAGKERRLPSELSGGERQRVALSRVLVRDRPVLLLDEPFASLGPALRREMLALVRQLHFDHGMTILMVTHHPEDAQLIADRIAFIEAGRIVAFEDTTTMFSRAAPDAFRAYIGA